MRNLVVRVASLYVFNVVVLLAIGLLLPAVRVGWSALWAAVILTAASMLLKPVLARAFRGAAARSASSRTRVGEKTVQYGIVFVVELIVWIATVVLSGVRVNGFFWGYVIPPLVLLIAWVVYDQIDDRVQTKAGELYDAAESRIGGSGRKEQSADAPPVPTPPTDPSATRAGREELKDGLTPEQRRMLDELG
ncbi:MULTISPECIES: phage holin family protein [Bacteria]|uniref:phage holin family protein n=1 Tax=Bacteria TaxID=2 RepID=UPI003C7DCEBD